MEVGSKVEIVKNGTETMRGPMDTCGFQGTVRLVDAQAGYCVQLMVSRIYQPYFWYSLAQLKPVAIYLVYPDTKQLEDSVDGRRRDIDECPISLGLLRSWLLTKVRAVPGHPLESYIATSMQFGGLIPLFADRSDDQYDKWSQAYDLRPKRPSINDVKPAPGSSFGASIVIRRPKIKK